MPPPPGKTSNFTDPPYIGTKFLVINCVFLPLAVIALAIRTWTRVVVVRSFRIDDCLMIMALILDAVMVAVTLDMLNYGLGNHMWDVPATFLSPHFLKLNLLAAVFYCAATGFTKVSVLAFYTRIFPSRKFHYAVWSIVFIAVGYSVASVLANIFSCDPVAMTWDSRIKEGSCMNRPVFYFANAALGIFTDFATVLVPIPWLRRLQMPLRQKLVVASILAMGCFVGVVSCIRLGTLYGLLKSPDLTWETTDALLWCAVELNLGITGGCITAMRPFVRRYFPRLLGLSTRDGGEYYSRSGRTHPLDPFPRRDHPSFTNGSNQYSTTLKGGRDNESEEHILATTASSSGLGGILHTVEFDIENSTHRK